MKDIGMEKLRKEIFKLEAEIAQCNTKIETLTKKLEDKEELFSSHYTQITRLTNRVEELAKTNIEKTNLIELKSTEIENLQKQIHNYEDKKEVYAFEEHQKLKIQLEAYQLEIHDLKIKQDKHDYTNEELQISLEKMKITILEYVLEHVNKDGME
jgi:chromosome segregation ATPase